MRERRSRARKRTIFNRQKRFIAFFLALVMTFTNISANWNAAYAGTAEEAAFEINGSDLLLALKEAVVNDQMVSADAFDFTNGEIDKFQELFLGNGVVYELFPEILGNGMEAELRIFARLPEAADDSYSITGDEEIIMMYINNSDVTLSCQTKIDDKSLKQVTVKSFENVFGDGEINLISKPLDEITILPSETESNASDNSNTPDSSEDQQPAVDEETGAETDSVEGETEAVLDNGNHDSMVEIEESSKEETAEPTENEAESEAEIQAEVTAEKEETAAEPVSDPIAAISMYHVPRVAEPSEEPPSIEEKSEPAELPSELDDDHAAPEPEISTEAEETGEPESEYVPEETLPAETVDNQPTLPEDETHGMPPEETMPSEETQPPTETESSAEIPTQAPDESTAESTTETEPVIPEETQPVPTEPEIATGSDAAQAEEAVKPDSADINDIVGIGNCSTAKVYSLSLNDLLKKSYPSFRYAETTDNGVKVTLRARAGVLPKDTTVEIVDVTDNVKDAVLESSDGALTDIVACDITLKDADGNILDNDSWIGDVQVAFSGSPVKEATQGSETVAVMCIDTEVDTTSAVLSAEDVNKLEIVNEIDSNPAEGINQVKFDAKHFTTYFAAGVSEWTWSYYSLYINQVLTDPATNNTYIQRDEIRLKKDNFINAEFDYSMYTADALKNPGVKLATVGGLIINQDAFDKYGDAEVEINYQLQSGYYVYHGSDGTDKAVNMSWISGERVQPITNEKYPIYINAQQYADMKGKTNSHPVKYIGSCDKIDGFYPKDRSMHYIPTRYDANAWVISYVRCDKYDGESEQHTYFRVVFEDEHGEMLKEMSVKENDRPVAPTDDIKDLEGWYLRKDAGQTLLDPLPRITFEYAKENSEAYPGGAAAIVFVAKTSQKPDFGHYKIDVDKDIIKVVTADGQVFEGKDAEDKAEHAVGGVTAGDTITYKVVVKNEGSLPLTKIKVSDRIMNSGNTIDLGTYSQIDEIAPRKSVSFTYDYTIQPEDVTKYDDEFELENRVEVIASERDKQGRPVKDSDSEDIDLKEIVLKPVVTIEKKASTTTPKPGDRITYTLTIRNEGNGPAKNVKVTDTIPNGLERITVSPRADRVHGRTYQWNISKLAPQETREITITATINSGIELGTEISNTATIEGGSSSTETITVTGSRLSIAKSASESAVKPGQTFNYVLKVSNTGNGAAQGVKITDQLPSELEFVKAVPDATLSKSNHLSWRLDSIAANSTQDIVITVKVKDSAEPGNTLENTAVLNDCQKSNKVCVEIIGNKVSITKTANLTKDQVVPGQEFTYTLTVKNLGKSSAKNVVVSDTLPPELEFVKSSLEPSSSDADQNQYQWTIKEISRWKDARIVITVRVKETVEPGTKILNTAYAEGKPSNGTEITVTGSRLEITKEASISAVKPGDGFYYRLIVKNTGNATAKDIRITDELSENLTFVSSLPYVKSIDGSVYEWNINSLKAGRYATVTVFVKVKDTVLPATEILNTAKVGDVTSNEVKVTVMDSNLVITKSVNKTDPKPGEKIVYTLTVHNTGNQWSLPSLVEDKLSGYLEFVRSESTYTASWGIDNTYRWILPAIGPDRTETITITAKVKENTPAGTIISNIGTVNGRESDPVEITVTGPSLEIQKTADNPSPVKGDLVTYTLKVTNSGNAATQDVLVKDKLPEGLELVTDGTTTGYVILEDGTLQWSFDNLDQNESRDVTIVARVVAKAGSQISNIGYVNDIPSVPEEVVVGDLSYTVKFYKDSTLDENYIHDADQTVKDVTLGTAIDMLNVDTTIANDKLPDGYVAKGIIDTDHSISVIGSNSEENIIKVYLTRRTNLSYTVNYYKDAIDDSQVVGEGNLLGSDRITDQEFQKVITGLDIDKTKYAPLGYTDEGRVDPVSIIIGTNEEENVINVIFDKDPARTRDISYRVEHYLGNETSPRDTETITVKVWIGDPGVITVTEESLTPKTYAGYTFRNYDPSDIKAGVVLEDGAVIKLMYSANSSTVTPGGGGSGGGGGGGGGNGSRRYTSTTGGPGEAVTINPEAVPLAEAPNVELIDDGEIPLAALPKTGQENARAELTLVLSGIFLVMAAINKRRREEV